MKHVIKAGKGTTTHVGEEVMLPFKGTIKGRILCGGLRENNQYEYEIQKTLNREAWFTPVTELSGVTCKKCNQRHLRYLEVMEGYRTGLLQEAPESKKEDKSEDKPVDFREIRFKTYDYACLLDQTGTCIRKDKHHTKPKVTAKDKWWVCPTTD